MHVSRQRQTFVDILHNTSHSHLQTTQHKPLPLTNNTTQATSTYKQHNTSHSHLQTTPATVKITIMSLNILHVHQLNSQSSASRCSLQWTSQTSNVTKVIENRHASFNL